MPTLAMRETCSARTQSCCSRPAEATLRRSMAISMCSFMKLYPIKIKHCSGRQSEERQPGPIRKTVRHRSTVIDEFRVDDREPLWRSEEHTSELQSLMRISYAGFCLK